MRSIATRASSPNSNRTLSFFKRRVRGHATFVKSLMKTQTTLLPHDDNIWDCNASLGTTKGSSVSFDPLEHPTDIEKVFADEATNPGVLWVNFV